jgi:hypothetical protein
LRRASRSLKLIATRHSPITIAKNAASTFGMSTENPRYAVYPLNKPVSHTTIVNTTSK